MNIKGEREKARKRLEFNASNPARNKISRSEANVISDEADTSHLALNVEDLNRSQGLNEEIGQFQNNYAQNYKRRFENFENRLTNLEANSKNLNQF